MRIKHSIIILCGASVTLNSNGEIRYGELLGPHKKYSFNSWSKLNRSQNSLYNWSITIKWQFKTRRKKKKQLSTSNWYQMLNTCIQPRNRMWKRRREKKPRKSTHLWAHFYEFIDRKIYKWSYSCGRQSVCCLGFLLIISHDITSTLLPKFSRLFLFSKERRKKNFFYRYRVKRSTAQTLASSLLFRRKITHTNTVENLWSHTDTHALSYTVRTHTHTNTLMCTHLHICEDTNLFIYPRNNFPSV